MIFDMINYFKMKIKEKASYNSHRRKGMGGGPSPPPLLDILLWILQKDLISIIIRPIPSVSPPPLFEFLCTPLIKQVLPRILGFVPSLSDI